MHNAPNIPTYIFYSNRTVRGLTLSGPGFFDMPKGRGGLIQPTGERWPVMASEATAEAKNRKNIVADTFLYL